MLRGVPLSLTLCTKAEAKRMLSADAPIRVQMEDISKSFGAIKSLDRVNLVLRAGEVLGLVGDNGAGKSTLSKILSGAVIPDSGRILLDGQEVRFASPADARRQRVEMVYQDLSLCDTVDVAGNLLLGREPLKRMLGVPIMDKRKMHEDAAQMLDHLGIRMPSTRLKVENLSGGQRQSIAIGRAVSFDPLVLIMDEPTAALAVAEVDAVLDLIRQVSAKGVSVILITHRLQDLFVVCDRIMVLYEGRNAAERLIGETNIEEIVNLIVGRKFRSVSAGARHGSGDADLTAVAVPAALRDRARLIVHDNGGVLSIAAFFVVMAVIFSLITDTFLTEANLLNILRQIAPLMIVAVAMTFVITTAGIDLSVGSVLALVNALAAISLQAGLYWPLVVALMLGVGIVIGAHPGLLHRL